MVARNGGLQWSSTIEAGARFGVAFPRNQPQVSATRYDSNRPTLI
jgi:hypothetical protein